MGRKNLPGRPLVYGTAKRFLEVFDLKDIESLPKLKEISALGNEEEEPQKAAGENAAEAFSAEDLPFGKTPPDAAN
jgi:segregation and condensation protein B